MRKKTKPQVIRTRPSQRRLLLKTFPIHTWLYILYIIFNIVLPVFGTLLLLCGSWTNTGKFSFESINNVPFPKVED